jgi:anti-sigma factor RsiW
MDKEPDMTHDRLKERMSDLYDGELSGDARREAENHLASCGECRLFYASLGAFSAGLSAMPAPEGDEAFTRRVMGRVRAEIPVKRVSGGPRIVPIQWFAPLIGIAAMALLAILPAQRTVSAEEIITGGQGNMTDVLAEEI